MHGSMFIGVSYAGGVAERSNAAVLKTAEVARLPWVRIPPPPQISERNVTTPAGVGSRPSLSSFALTPRFDTRWRPGHRLSPRPARNAPCADRSAPSVTHHRPAEAAAPSGGGADPRCGAELDAWREPLQPGECPR